MCFRLACLGCPTSDPRTGHAPLARRPNIVGSEDCQ